MMSCLSSGIQSAVVTLEKNVLIRYAVNKFESQSNNEILFGNGMPFNSIDVNCNNQGCYAIDVHLSYMYMLSAVFTVARSVMPLTFQHSSQV